MFPAFKKCQHLITSEICRVKFWKPSIINIISGGKSHFATELTFFSHELSLIQNIHYSEV